MENEKARGTKAFGIIKMENEEVNSLFLPPSLPLLLLCLESGVGVLNSKS